MIKQWIGQATLAAALTLGATTGLQAEEKETLNFGIISTESTQNLRTVWDPFLADMSEQLGMEVEGVGMQVGGGRVGTEVEGGETDEEAPPVDGASGGDLACCWGCWLWVLAVGSSLGFGMLDFGVVPGRAFPLPAANIFT